jgi:hypothetical protein
MRRPRGRANDKYNVSLTIKSFKTTEVKKKAFKTQERDVSFTDDAMFHS